MTTSYRQPQYMEVCRQLADVLKAQLSDAPEFQGLPIAVDCKPTADLTKITDGIRITPGAFRCRPTVRECGMAEASLSLSVSYVRAVSGEDDFLDQLGRCDAVARILAVQVPDGAILANLEYSPLYDLPAYQESALFISVIDLTYTLWVDWES